MYIEFKKISFKNIGGYGEDEQTIHFEKGLSLIIGKNGQGKSTIIQALNYVLYGKPFAKIKLASLKNKYSDGAMLVTLELEVNGDLYIIERGLKPTKFNIYKNKELIPFTTVKDYQAMLENDILRMSENIFKQLVALGANVENAKHFMELNQKEKEEILQILTDTRIFSMLIEEIRLLKSDIKGKLTTKLIEVNTKKESLVKTKRLLEDLTVQNENVKENRDQRISELLEKLEDLNNIVEAFKTYSEKFQTLKERFEPYFSDYNKIVNEYNVNVQKKNHLLGELSSFNNSDEVTCPECGANFKEIQLKKTVEVEKIKKDLEDIEKVIQNHSVEMQRLKEIIEKYKSKEIDFNSELAKSRQAENNIIFIKNEINTLENQHEISTIETEKQIDELSVDIEKESALVALYERDMNDYAMLENILSIKNITGKIISTQIPLLNTFINEYLEKFEVDYQFFLSKDLKESITRRDEEFEYYSLSNGEKQRIVLSILFSFLKLIEMSVKINILFLDEFLDSSLDEEGTSLVLEILKEDFKEKNVFIISHKQEVKSIDDVAKSVYKVSKDDRNKYSKIEKV